MISNTASAATLGKKLIDLPRLDYCPTDSMTNIVVFTAGNREARVNYEASILKPVPATIVFDSFPPERHKELRKIEILGGGFYAWGAKPLASKFFWERLAIGDAVLCFFEFQYRAVCRLVGKAESRALAKQLWGGADWSRILFLSKPQLVNVDAKDTCPPLSSTYRGITRISSDRTSDIISKYGSIQNFLQKKFGVTLAEMVGLKVERERQS